MECPGTGVGGSDQHVPALARSDVEGVALPGCGLIPSILGDHGHVHPMEVHWMDHHPLIHEPNPDGLSLPAYHRLSSGEALSVQSEPVRAIVQHHDVIDVGSM